MHSIYLFPKVHITFQFFPIKLSQYIFLTYDVLISDITIDFIYQLYDADEDKILIANLLWVSK